MEQNGETLDSLVHGWAEQDPDRVALLATDGASAGYGALAAQVDNLAAELAGLGVGADATIGVVHPDGPAMAVAFLGISTQAACAPLNPSFTAHELEFEIDDLGLVALVVGVGDAERPAAVEAAARRGVPVFRLTPSDAGTAWSVTLVGQPVGPPVPVAEPDADRVALVLHTSGTTGQPKIVPLRHRNLVASARAVATTLRLTPDDRCCAVMPLFHIHGLVAALCASLAAGASVVCTPGFDAGSMLRWLSTHRATWYTAVPTMHQALVDRGARRPEELAGVDLQFVRSSSASLPPTVMASLEDVFGAPVIEAYGMTEAAHQMTSNPLPPGERRAGSVGVPAGPKVAIMDELGRLLAPGELGEIVIAGAGVMDGYLDNPAADATAFTAGWFRTGDQGRFDDGYLVITGRLKEMINRGGESLSPREIDEALLAHPSVAQAVTFAVADERLGEQVAAAVVPVAGAVVVERELRSFLAERLAPAKIPRRIVTVDELPKGPSGKLQRIGLAERLGLADLDGGHRSTRDTRPPAGPVEEFLAELWSTVLSVDDDLAATDHFLDVGGDSLSAIRLLARMRDEVDVDIAMIDFFDAPTIESQARLLEELLLAADPLPPVVSR